MQVRVYNTNDYPYRENFKGEWIEIKPGAYKVMELGKAENFVGTYCPAKKTPMGQPDPMTFKRLEIRPHDVAADAPKEPTKWICNADGKEFATEAEMKAWEQEHHLDKLTDPKVAEEIRKKAKSK